MNGQNCSREEVEDILGRIKRCVAAGHFTVSLNRNRQENIDFISEYNIRDSRQKSIIMGLKVEDFCHSTPNRNSGYEDEILYIFAPHVILYNADGEEETVAVYMKFNLISRPRGEYTVVISFHKLNYPIQYMFRQGG